MEAIIIKRFKLPTQPIWVVVSLLAVALIGVSVSLWVQTSDLLNICKDNREAISQIIIEQNEQSQQGLESGQYAKFFPNVPEDVLRKSILESIERREVILRSVNPDECSRF